MLMSSKVKNKRQRKLKANRNTTNKIVCEKICNLEVSRFSRAKQRQRNVQKSVQHARPKFFFFLLFSLPSLFIFLVSIF